MIIRRATLDDASQIASIHVASWKHAYRGIIPDDYIAGITHQSRLTYWEEVLGKDDLAVFVAVDEIGSVLGWAATGRDREEPGVTTITEIQAMYVHPAHTRNGVGTELFAYIFNGPTVADTTTVTVWVLEKNEPAVRFYHKQGFFPEPVKSLTIERGGARLVDLKLEMRLSRSETSPC